MSNSSIYIECADPTCAQSGNALGQRICRQCRQPLVHRYVWAVGMADLPKGERVGDRYVVMAPQVWLDTQPGRHPALPAQPPQSAIPYLKLRSHHLHVPDVFGVCDIEGQAEPVILLENGAIDRHGVPYPSLATAWETATPARRIYWLWQLFQLWRPLAQLGAIASLLQSENMRVEGWRVQLRELILDGEGPCTEGDAHPAGLTALAAQWLVWIGDEPGAIAQRLRTLCYEMQSLGQLSPALAPLTDGTTAALEPSVDWSRLAPQLANLSHKLNELLLEQASLLPLKLRIAGGTTTGPQRSHNEDACYPNAGESNLAEDIALKPHLAVICDGIGGHAGGEVASRLALRSLKLQLSALLTEVAEQADILPPEVVSQQLEAILRIANNMIAAQNDSQGRTARQRMATTVVLALQLPQRIHAEGSDRNTHELYLAHIGDSRAYWLTERYCQRLTCDHDVAHRETSLGYSLSRAAQLQPGSGALTQALGTRDADFISPTVQRFILDEDGILLLCSDGLSDNHQVETLWEETTQQLLQDKISLETAVRTWLEIANQNNGHDNSTVVMLDCRVAQPQPVLFPAGAGVSLPTMSLSDTSRALLYPEESPEVGTYGDAEDLDSLMEEIDLDLHDERDRSGRGFLGAALWMALLCFVLGGAGWLGWRYVQTHGVYPILERLIMPEPTPASEASPTSPPETPTAE